MKNTFFFFGVIALFFSCTKSIDSIQAQVITLNQIGELPEILDESSGLSVDTEQQVYAVNDHNGENAVYVMNQKGELLHTVVLSNAKNKDWEDLAKDEEGNLYVADTGNNDNDRTNLRIYKVMANQLNTDDSIIVEKIKFTFADQTEFPPVETNLHFDTEAVIAHAGYLWLFTRDRSKPFSGKTRLYKLPLTPGEYVAEYVTDFATDSDKSQGAIRGAAINQTGTKLALVSKEMLWIFNDFSGTDFFNGKVEKYTLSTHTQVESIAFKDDCTLLFSDEKNKEEGGKLYEARICD